MVVFFRIPKLWIITHFVNVHFPILSHSALAISFPYPAFIYIWYSHLHHLAYRNHFCNLKIFCFYTKAVKNTPECRDRGIDTLHYSRTRGEVLRIGSEIQTDEYNKSHQPQELFKVRRISLVVLAWSLHWLSFFTVWNLFTFFNFIDSFFEIFLAGNGVPSLCIPEKWKKRGSIIAVL